MGAIYIALGVFVAGIALAVVLNKLKLGDSPTFITLLLIPLLVYAVAAGMLDEFTAPGGWGAKFRQAAKAEVAPVPLTKMTEAIQRLDVVEKGGLDVLAGLSSRLEKNKPIALTFELGQRGYSADAAIKYVEVLLLTDSEMTALFLDADHHFVAMTEGTTLLTLLRASPQGQQLINAIAENNKNYILSLPGFHSNSIQATDTNVAALEKMRQQNARAIVVVDDQNRPTGVVKRDDIVARLLENLAASDKPS